VTDEAVRLVDGEVQSLNNLGVAGGTSNFHPPSQIAQMFSMRKADILIEHVPF
jgi:hypothetical protein